MEEQNWQQENQSQSPENVQMSEVGTLTGIFFEPGNTFLSFVTKPRFLMAGILSIIVIMTFQQLFWQRIGEERMTRYIAKEVEKSPQVESLPADKKKEIVEQQVKFSKYGQFAAPIVMIILFLIGGLIYWLAGNAMGGNGSFLKGLAVWIYSSFPPTIVSMLCNILVLFLKSPDDIDIGMSQRGLLNANLSFLIDGKSMPVLATLIGTLDVFMIWGWILAAIGLKLVCKISSTSAWAIVLILALVSVAFRVVISLISGNPS
jgi:hypothetical protein